MFDHERSTLTYPQFIELFNNRIKRAESLNFFVRDLSLQKEIIEELIKLKFFAKKYKEQARSLKNEKGSNRFFYMQCIINAYISSLSVWVALKELEPKSAWNNLIDAQEYLAIAVKAGNDHAEAILKFKEYLQTIEHVIFPPFSLYNSIGIILQGGVCSICGEPIELCEHLEGEIYMGSICRREDVTEIEIDHYAFVESPRDRRCIITEIELEPGRIHDYITLKFLREEETSESESHKLTGIVYKFNDLDIT